MKNFIMYSLVFVVAFTTSICSAAQTRVCDYSLNDFVNYYNHFAKMIHEHSKEFNLVFNEQPFKNIAISNSQFTVYTSTVGKEKDNIVFAHFYLDKSGRVAKIYIAGNTKKAKQENLISGVIMICLMSCGVSYEEFHSMADSDAGKLFFFSPSHGYFKPAGINREIHIESHMLDVPEGAKDYRPYAVDIYAMPLT